MDSSCSQRNLNNAFAYDLVPAPSVVVAALKAARRVNDYPTAVRIFDGMYKKVEVGGDKDGSATYGNWRLIPYPLQVSKQRSRIVDSTINILRSSRDFGKSTVSP